MAEVISDPLDIALDPVSMKRRKADDPVRLGLRRLSSNISTALELYPEAQEVALVDHIPECRIKGWDTLGYRQRLPMPEGIGWHLISRFVREGSGGIVRGNILPPSINRQDMTTYVLNEACVVGLEVSDKELPLFILSGIKASRRFFCYHEGDVPRIAKRDSEPDRYLREINAALEFLHKGRSGCEYIPNPNE